jgi:iron complex outermembrane receptor protein
MGGDETLLNSDARDNHQHAGLALIGDKGSIGASYRRYKFIYGLPGEAGDDELGLKIDGQRDEGSLRVDLGGGRGAFRGLSVTGTAQAYKHSEIENTGEVGTAFDLKTQTGAATAKTAFGSIEGAIGASGLFKQYAATGEEALTPAADTKSFGLFLFEQMPLGQATEHGVNLQFGARLDTYSIESKAGDPKFGSPRSRDFTAFSGSLGVTIPFGPQASLGVNVARAFRAPTVEELFSNAFHAAEGAYDVGNPDLDPETNNGIEGVYRIQASKVNGQFSAYFNKIDNYIVPDIRGDTLFEGELVPLNRFSQSNATLKGIEGSVEGEVVRHVVVGVQGDVVRATLSGGDNVPFMPPARLGARARWDNGRFNVGGEVRHGFKQDKVSGGDLDVPTDAYTLVNLTAGFSMISAGRVHTVTLRLDNATDEQYADATSFIKSFAFNPGRNVALVYKVLF